MPRVVHPSQRIYNARIKLGMTRLQLAQKLGVTQQSISGWELRTHRIRRKHLLALMDALPGLDLSNDTEALVVRCQSNASAENKPKTAGQIIKTARLALGLSQEEVAASLGITSAFFSDFERGKPVVPRKYIGALKNILPNMDVKSLWPAVAREANPIITNDDCAIQIFSEIILAHAGSVVVFGSMSAGVVNKGIMDSLSRFLQIRKNHIDFIIPFETEDAFASETQIQAKRIATIKQILSGNNDDLTARVGFYSPASFECVTTTQVSSLNRLLYPFTTTLLFEPKINSATQTGLVSASADFEGTRGKNVWLRPSSDSLGKISSLLKSTLWSRRRDKFLIKLS